ncbi:ornithine cyclodeaminase [Longispora fulva]|uniref:Ornithine cyclodeaminase n=1 Tax=Longispora fulva TaxID=619741 RepID=A0A8J7KJ78_9ACTN|nr:ornithine cyclodeaminase family protein [Longispora fulva]MBG6135186.1 ornithine cyclodeaminase [Longispora fulva]GIG56579.1 ornithine cyclodeaminase [Longispora fulva]
MSAPAGTDLAALGLRGAIAAIADALCAGLDPEADPPRSIVDVPAGQLLLMPASHDGYAGVKVATVAPGNPALGLPRIQALYLLLDAATLTPVATLDGTALTALRTPATSAVAVAHLAAPDAAHLLVFGTGPQAAGHVAAVRAVRPISRVTVVGRDPGRAERFAAEWGAVVGVPDEVADADVICCCTTASTPLFPGGLVRSTATVVAVGSHEPAVRETDDDLVARSDVWVEARSAAFREAGDLIDPVGRGVITPGHVRGTLSDLVTGRVAPRADRPRFFKGVGMAWQDLVVAAAAHRGSPSSPMG